MDKIKIILNKYVAFDTRTPTYLESKYYGIHKKIEEEREEK